MAYAHTLADAAVPANNNIPVYEDAAIVQNAKARADFYAQRDAYTVSYLASPVEFVFELKNI
ncbi:MAG: hypothetical protein MUF15_01000 [Acidobacteria bacterium]|nr:hypothetical protein [Acidobacteriota bacterium]